MQSEQQFSNLVYEYFLLRIQFGYYRYGDVLPSIETLCREFNLAPKTVNMGLRRLRTEGYVSMRNGQLTRVACHLTEEEQDAYSLCYFSERRDAFYDTYESFEQLFVPLLLDGMRRMDEGDLAHLSRLAKRADADDLIHFLCYSLQKLDNPLALNLFWEMALFLGFPFAKRRGITSSYRPELAREKLLRLTGYIKSRNWDAVRSVLVRYPRSDIDAFSKVMDRTLYQVPEQERVPFSWRLYRDRPQLCYTLASRLVHEIYLGAYSKAELLPSYEKLAERYGVSLMTMRRTVGLLNRAGITRTVNGRGTVPFHIGERCPEPDYTHPAVRRSLAYFVQAFELVICSCRDVTRSLLADLDPVELDTLVGRLEGYLHSGRWELSLWIYLFTVAQRSPLLGIRVVYGTIYDLFLWGYPLSASSQPPPRLSQAMLAFTERIIACLKAYDVEGCADAVKALMSYQLPAAKAFLLQKGLTQQELRLTPSIRFLINE